MHLDAVLLSRLQFAFVVAFHFLLPAFTIGLASYIAVLEGLHLFTKKPIYLRISNFWIKIFAVSFGMGVVSGIVMPFQFGTNWSRYSDMVADVVAPLMAYEGLTAFFLEAGFLGVLLFGRKLVPSWAHFLAALMVAIGTLFSTFWILVVNSWMHTPNGFSMVNGRFYPFDWLEVIWNPSFPFRFMHTVTAVYLTTAFTVIGVAAHYLRRGRFVAESKVMLVMGLGLATVLVPAQALLGDLHGLNTLHYQPQKLAAIEGLWETRGNQSMVLFAIPDEAAEANHAAIEIPGLASLYLAHSIEGRVLGLRDFPKEDRPPVIVVFYAFRIMLAMWGLMMLITVWSWWLGLKRRLYETHLFLRVCNYAIPVGFVAVTAGWVTTEAGRQPWVVYGFLRTADAVTPNLSSGDVTISLVMYALVYAFVFGAGLYYLFKLVGAGPALMEAPELGADKRPARPLSAADAD
ncbi:MAG TPA: cytochrome ubiquinol oxidase subunit I [Casimicrobiaceae bacterium]|nr:cytochrome ubiquinol oxidase subunit I [Casimicrobiaceae bacterium]